MDEDIRFGIGVTGLIVSISYVLGDIGGLIASLAFCSIPWACEIRDRRNNQDIEIITCELCGSNFKINNKIAEYEHRTLGNICPMCIEKIFKFTKLGADELVAEEPVE
jgi:hypothetical protein